MLSLGFSSNLSLHPPPPSSSLNSSTLPFSGCFEFPLVSDILTLLLGFYILFFLPLCVAVLHLGRRRRSTASNTDIFTYNVVAMEVIGVFGIGLYCASGYAEARHIQVVAVYILSSITPGQMLFHILTCVERYLAVIHPIFYLRLRKAGGVRNASIGCVWVVSCGWVGLVTLYSRYYPSTLFATLLVFGATVTSFCSLAVLCALIRPGPGEGGGDRARVDQLKKKAFHIVGAITGALLLRFGGQLVCALMDVSAEVSDRGVCLSLATGMWMSLPSSYVLPLLFLQRAGKLTCFKHTSNTESGRRSETSK